MDSCLVYEQFTVSIHIFYKILPSFYQFHMICLTTLTIIYHRIKLTSIIIPEIRKMIAGALNGGC